METILTASTKKPRFSDSLQSSAIPPCCGDVARDAIMLSPCTNRGYQSSASLVSVKTVHPTPIWRSPLAAAAKPAPRPLLMFHVATEKVLLPSGREGANEADIGIGIPSIINKSKNQRPN